MIGMKAVCSVLIVILGLPLLAVAQSAPVGIPAWYGIEQLGEYLGLTVADISFRADYTQPDSFRLQLVADLMNEPLGMIGYAEGLKRAHIIGQPEILSAILLDDLARQGKRQRSRPYQPTPGEMAQNYNLVYSDMLLNQLLTKLALYVDVIIPKSTNAALSNISTSRRRFLTGQFKQLVSMSVERENMTVQQIDSVDKVEEQYIQEFVTFGHLFDKDPIIYAGVDCLRDLIVNVSALRNSFRRGETTPAEAVRAVSVLPQGQGMGSYLGRQKGWKIGGPGNDYYEGEYEVIIDVGGDDIYDLTYDPSDPHPVVIVDLSGNDHYRSKSDFTIASGCLSAGILLDFDGNDRYDAASFGLGSGFFGFGILYDAAGDDRYDGDTHVQGAASFGLGIIIDEGGRDIYNSAAFSQGFGFIEGFGLIHDLTDSDTYYAGGKYLDVLRYDDRYLSMSQGFGYGLRPYASGGIGIIIDGTGNDNYYADIFAQGSSYWWSLGMIYDSLGNDQYSLFQYGQGCGTHMTLGALIDDAGNDVYFGKGLMQGCGHDYSCGLLLDRGGDDTYTAYDLSQGAGSANGTGIQIDISGNDRYFIHNPGNTHGYGNPRRDFGSIGLFIDLRGDDQYTGHGDNDFYWRTDSKWGGGMDINSGVEEDVATR